MNSVLRQSHEEAMARRARLGGAYVSVINRAIQQPASKPKLYVNDVIADPSALTVTAIYSPGIRKIAKLVSEYYHISLAELLGRRREYHVVLPRQICFYLCKKCTARSLPEIGRNLNDFDHTTILHASRKIEKLRKIDPEIDRQLCELESHFQVATATHVYWGA